MTGSDISSGRALNVRPCAKAFERGAEGLKRGHCSVIDGRTWQPAFSALEIWFHQERLNAFARLPYQITIARKIGNTRVAGGNWPLLRVRGCYDTTLDNHQAKRLPVPGFAMDSRSRFFKL